MKYKKKSYRKTYKPSVTSIVKKELMRSIETKHVNHIATSWIYLGAINGTITNITDISQGVGDNQRVGNRITLTKLYVQKLLRIKPLSTSPYATARVLLVQSRGGSLSTSDMPGFASPVDLDKMYVLKDIMVPLSSQGIDGTSFFGSNPKRLKFNISFRSLPKNNIQYNDTSSIPQNNSIYLYMIADNDNAEQCGFETAYYKDA